MKNQLLFGCPGRCPRWLLAGAFGLSLAACGGVSNTADTDTPAAPTGTAELTVPTSAWGSSKAYTQFVASVPLHEAQAPMPLAAQAAPTSDDTAPDAVQ